MIVWITHAKVGHRQTPYKVKRPARNGGAFCFVGLIMTCLSSRQDAREASFLRRRLTLLAKLSPIGAAVAKVGHRQTPYKEKHPAQKAGCFSLWNLICDLLEFMKTNSFRELVSVKTHIGTIDVMSEPQHAAQQRVAAQAIGYNMAFGQ
jgi:hypothetical protein